MPTRKLTRAITHPLTRAITQAAVGGRAISNTMDLFIIVGQSNAQGVGDSSLSPASLYGAYITGTTLTEPLADPVGGAVTGSAWPSFSNAWAELTGNRSAFVEQAHSGSGLTAAGSAWSPTGAARANAVTACNNAITAINASDYDLGNVYFVWIQGETEATTINGTTITGATHEAALETLADYFKAQVPSMVTMAVVNIAGTGGSGGVTSAWSATHSGYQEIREAIYRACNDNANLIMAYDGSHHFVGRGLLSDGTHYYQQGYDIIGEMAAAGIVNGHAVPTITNPVLATATYADPTFTISNTRSANHTTAAGTDFLIVAVAHSIPESSTNAVPTATFGGVAMRRAGHVQRGGGTPAGSVTAAVFYIDEATYGGSLDAVTASIAVSTSANQSIIDWATIDCNQIGAMDSDMGAFPAVPANVTDISTTLSTFHPALVVTVGASAASTAATLTATLTNATEVMDHSMINAGNTRSGQTVVGYSYESSPVVSKAYTISWSANCTHMAQATFAFRAKMAGEFT